MANGFLTDSLEPKQQSAFGVKPSDLAQPVPGTGEERVVENSKQSPEQELAALGIEGFSDQPQPVQLVQPEDELAQLGVSGFETEVPVEQPLATQAEGDFPVQERSESLIQDLANQFKDAGLRFKSSFAVTNPEKESLLVKTFGKENVRFSDGDFFIKSKETGKFRKLDQDGFELIGDVLDFSREAMEEVVALPFEIGGAIAGTFLGGPGAGTAAGAVTGRVASAPARIKAADALAEFFGVERDPKRSLAIESTIAGTLDAVIPVVGSKIAKGMANRKAAKIAKKEANHVILRKSSQEFEQISKELKNSGLIQNIPGTDTPFLVWQLHPHDPKAQVLRKNLADNPEIQNMLTRQGEAIADTVTDLTQEIVGKTKFEGSLPKKLVDIVDGVVKKEGEVINLFRKKVKGIAGKQPLPTPNTSQAVKEIFDEIGISARSGGLKFPSDQDLAGILGTDSKLIINGFKNDLSSINKQLLSGGGMNIDSLLAKSKLIGAKNKGASRIGGQYKRFVGKLSSSLRSDSREGMALVLSPEDAASYRQSMDRFVDIMDTQNSLARTLNDEISSEAFIKILTTKGKDSLPQIKSARALLQKEHPEVWSRIKGDFFDNLINKHSSDKATGLKSDALLKDLKSYGDEYLTEIFDGNLKNKSDFVKLVNFAKRLEKTDISAGGRDAAENLIKEASGFFYNSPFLRVRSALNILRVGVKKNILPLEVISEEGIEKFLGRVPKNGRARVAKLWDDMIKMGRASGLFSERAAKISVRSGQIEAQE